MKTLKKLLGNPNMKGAGLYDTEMNTAEKSYMMEGKFGNSKEASNH